MEPHNSRRREASPVASFVRKYSREISDGSDAIFPSMRNFTQLSSTSRRTHPRPIEVGETSTVDRFLEPSRGSTTYEVRTNFGGTNGNFGAMFDIVALQKNVIVHSLDFHANIEDPNCSIMIYARKGTHVGYTKFRKGWKMLVNATVVCQGSGKRSHVSHRHFLENNQQLLHLKPRETLGMYVHLSTPHLRYVDGKKRGAIVGVSDYLKILEGSGLSDFFGRPVEPRIWNGAIHYRLADEDQKVDANGRNRSKSGRVLDDDDDFTHFDDDDNTLDSATSTSTSELQNVISYQGETCEKELTTTYMDNLGSYGNMFDIVALNDINVYQFDMYTDLTTDVYFELYTKRNSFRDDNGKHDISVWTYMKSGIVRGRGFRRGTPIQGFDHLVIPTGTKQAFYITLNTTDIRYRSISDEMPDAVVGTPFITEDDLEVHVGVSVGEYPMGQALFGKRVWCGTIHYMANEACPSSKPSFLPSSLPSFLPTVQPSIEPSEVPSNEPSAKPSRTPTVKPTLPPTPVPSPEPTTHAPIKPDETMEPTGVASETPTKIPSLRPSLLPTPLPSAAPSIEPSGTPSLEPTDSPTTTTPSNKPTPKPTPSPTATPTLNPTPGPTAQQSSSHPTTIAPILPEDTRQPTIIASSEPSSEPSGDPTHINSIGPSGDPSTSPSIPLLFRGNTILNKRHSQIPSSSQIPSQPLALPSQLPSQLPSLRGTSYPSYDPDECLKMTTIGTDFNATSGAFGNMFTVTSKASRVKITSFSFHTDFMGNLTAEVYTRPDKFVGFEDKPQEWTRISQATVEGLGDTIPTPIPEDQFEAVEMLPQTTIAFYITLQSADIRYSKTNLALGDAVAEDEHVAVNVGIGVADYPFATEFYLYSPRVFNGVVHLQVPDEVCLPRHKIVFSFEVQAPSSYIEQRVLNLVSKCVSNVLDTLMNNDEKLIGYQKNYDLSLERVVSTSAGGCDSLLSELFRCVKVDSEATFEHASSLQTGKLDFDLLQHRVEVTLGVQLHFQTKYTGEVPSSVGMIISLESKNSAQRMTVDQMRSLEEGSTGFFRQQLKESGLKVTAMNVDEQKALQLARRGLSDRILKSPFSSIAGQNVKDLVQDGVDGVVQVHATIMSQFTPPPELQLSNLIDGTTSKADEYIAALQEHDEYFETFTGVALEKVKEKSIESAVESIEGPAVVGNPVQAAAKPTDYRMLVLLCVSGVILIVFGYCIYSHIQRQKDKKNKYHDVLSTTLRTNDKSNFSEWFQSKTKSMGRPAKGDDLSRRVSMMGVGNHSTRLSISTFGESKKNAMDKKKKKKVWFGGGGGSSKSAQRKSNGDKSFSTVSSEWRRTSFAPTPEAVDHRKFRASEASRGLGSKGEGSDDEDTQNDMKAFEELWGNENGEKNQKKSQLDEDLLGLNEHNTR